MKNEDNPNSTIFKPLYYIQKDTVILDTSKPAVSFARLRSRNQRALSVIQKLNQHGFIIEGYPLEKHFYAPSFKFKGGKTKIMDEFFKMRIIKNIENISKKKQFM
jgi:hypothetical protein